MAQNAKTPLANGLPPGPRFRFPSAFTILFALIVLVAALTWIVPAGLYDRVPSEALGKDVPIAGSYKPTDRKSVV